jgi:GDP-4-dehydro-6-deoxy-D-mannose reductase
VKKTVFVTGAEGFTGRHLSTLLKQRGYEVVGGVRNRARKLAYEKQFGKSIVCEVSDAINVARAIASVRPDAVVHLAGPSQEQAATDDPLTAYQSTVTAWANILDGVRRSVPRAKVVLASSWEVYGDASNGNPCVETMPCKPTNALGGFKANAEAVAGTYYRNYHLNISIARAFPYVGAGMSEISFFGDLARRIQTGGETLRVAHWSSNWDLLGVSDVVEAYAKLLDDGKPNEIYNICSGKTWNIEQAAQQIAGATRANIRFEAGEGSATTLCGNNTKLRQLGWEPKQSIEAALADLTRSVTPQTAAAA